LSQARNSSVQVTWGGGEKKEKSKRGDGKDKHQKGTHSCDLTGSQGEETGKTQKRGKAGKKGFGGGGAASAYSLKCRGYIPPPSNGIKKRGGGKGVVTNLPGKICGEGSKRKKPLMNVGRSHPHQGGGLKKYRGEGGNLKKKEGK